MKHVLSEEEYKKYLVDMRELSELRRVKNDFAGIARSYFDDIAFWLEHGRTKEMMFGMISVCKKENAGGCEYYCDCCPFPDIFGCPFGYEVEYSK
jgi:hypothetical protein